ncbi:MAG: hypothetical protein IMF11_17305 [Proteobacteria bacterium]|nr:hypothetical protein [Pseudomonadota bacterium]
MSERQLLRAKARNLRSQMRKLGPMIQGSVVLRRMKCGKPNCRCNRGHPHTFLCVTYKEKGKTRTVYVNKTLHGDALLWSRNYKQFKKLLKEHSLKNLEILKSR